MIESEEGKERTVDFEGRDILDELHRLGIGVTPRIAVVETIHVRHEKQIIGLNHGGGDGGEGVIVAEFDLLGRAFWVSGGTRACWKMGLSHSYGQSIILVDNWDDAEVEELPEGVLGVDVLCSLRIGIDASASMTG